jgi:predicted ribosome quality control (RQC) complex YloA/Tae2 family protein
MDAFLLKQVVAELGAALPGALVSKVHQPAEKEIVLTLWTGRDAQNAEPGDAAAVLPVPP